jgi:signal peptidase II
MGGKYFEFFQFIFNIADACITIGVAIILIFQKQFFREETNTIQNATETA